jgi:hypothetical protein
VCLDRADVVIDGADGKLLYGSGLIGIPYTATLKLV